MTTDADPKEGDGKDTPTLTVVQAEKMRDDALSGAGREKQTLDGERTQIDSDRAQYDSDVAAFRASQDEAADAAHKDNPPALAQLRSQRELDRGLADLKRKTDAADKRDEALTTRESSSAKLQHATLAGKISQEFGVPIEPLLSNTDGTEDQMRALAPLLTKAGAPPPDETPPDSYRGAGGVEITSDNIDKLHGEGKVSDAVYRNFLRTGQITVGV